MEAGRSVVKAGPDWIRGSAAMALLLHCAACASNPQHGQSFIELLAPIAAPQAGTDAKVSAAQDLWVDRIPPSLIGEMTKPAYPAGALAAHVGDCVVFVTITIDTAGRVSEVAPSWQRLSIPNRHSAEFMDAVAAAARQWRFEPARLVYWEREPNGENKYLYAEVVPAKTDVKLTFREGERAR